MSDTTSTGTGDTHPPVTDHDPEAINAAVAARLAAPAPADPLEQRFAQVDSFIQRWQPVLEMAEAMIAGSVPGAAPIVNRVSQIETWASQLLLHFGNKIPALPLPPSE